MSIDTTHILLLPFYLISTTQNIHFTSQMNFNISQYVEVQLKVLKEILVVLNVQSVCSLYSIQRELNSFNTFTWIIMKLHKQENINIYTPNIDDHHTTWLETKSNQISDKPLNWKNLIVLRTLIFIYLVQLLVTKYTCRSWENGKMCWGVIKHIFTSKSSETIVLWIYYSMSILCIERDSKCTWY